MGYEQIVVTDELSTSVQRASGIPLRRNQTLGELVEAMAAQRRICGPVDLMFDLARDWISHPAGGSGGGTCRC